MLLKISTLIGCCLIHLGIGSIYASSVLYQDICKTTGWDTQVPVWGFGLTIFFLGISAAFFRRFSEGVTVKRELGYSAVCYILVQIAQWLTIFQTHSIQGYLISSALVGIPLGVLYSATVAEAAKLFKRVAVCSGLVVMSFGFGSLLAANCYKELLKFSFYNVTLYFFAAWLLIVVGVTLFRSETVIISKPMGDILKNRRWQILFVSFFLNICAGLWLLSRLVPATVSAGFSFEIAVTLVGLAGIANGLGRIVFTPLADSVGRYSVFKLILILQVLALALLQISWIPAVLLSIAVYGAGFSLVPGICKDLFEDGDTAYGILLTAWGLAGLTIIFI